MKETARVPAELNCFVGFFVKQIRKQWPTWRENLVSDTAVSRILRNQEQHILMEAHLNLSKALIRFLSLSWKKANIFDRGQLFLMDKSDHIPFQIGYLTHC